MKHKVENMIGKRHATGRGGFPEQVEGHGLRSDIKKKIKKIQYEIQSTLVISKSKGPSETLRDIRTSTYQICRIEENTNGTTKCHK